MENGLVLFQDGYEVINMLFAYVLYSKIAHTKSERAGDLGVGPQDGENSALTVLLCV